MATTFFQGEFVRTIDPRFRLVLPSELLAESKSLADWVLVKERPGALSLWPAVHWQPRHEAALAVVASKWAAGRLDDRLDQLQQVARLLSTRHRPVQLAGRGRLVTPEGFREFLGVEPGGEVMVIGAGPCLELWRPAAWRDYLGAAIPQFGAWFDELSR